MKGNNPGAHAPQEPDITDGALQAMPQGLAGVRYGVSEAAAALAQAEADNDTLAQLLKQRDDQIASMREQMAALLKQNIAMLHTREPFLELADRFDITMAVEALQFALSLERTGARVGFRPDRNPEGEIVGLKVVILAAAAGRGAAECVEMAVTAGEDDVAERQEAA